MEGLLSLLIRGGPIVWLLIALSLVTVALILVKLADLGGALGGGAMRETALSDWAAGRRDAAMTAVAAGRSPVDALLAAAMKGLAEGRSRTALDEELEWRGNAVLDRLGRHLRTLELVAMISPLLGLLGTVLGMIRAFQELALAEGAANAALLAGGIWTALLTTAAGLIVAIPAAISASLLSARVDRVGTAMEVSVGRLMSVEANGETG
ncbi:MotA/TolQ/ExbB proton channel family protein [Tropicimonas sp. IMCC6043]|uniref:MotA/TolQ/ExbB proton channel family protein n=1 Tax=Tropicimonas sp. IMCC6043 TaxID=2510645 RepID=UPI00101B96D8|nr:MotA/TolQ/ExbB proton channel family protein [Tropicimonas sp. IMCC6043]RYH09341.1 MotA/TolQ/ExbB proton channel family protein [Tropicimonas sp. IMCC6043]